MRKSYKNDKTLAIETFKDCDIHKTKGFYKCLLCRYFQVPKMTICWKCASTQVVFIPPLAPKNTSKFARDKHYPGLVRMWDK